MFATTKPGYFELIKVDFVPDAKIAHVRSAEDERILSKLYLGPVFGELSETVRDELQDFIADRWFDIFISEFAPIYVDCKVQDEDISWSMDVAKWLEKK
jgi:complement component 1 Q subcomponent-binding protein